MAQVQTPAPLKPPTVLAAPPQFLRDLDDIERLANEDPEKALKLLQLKELLESRRNKETDRSQRLTMATQVAQKAEAQMRQTAADQHLCGLGGHRRGDGQSAIGGQKDSRGDFRGVCAHCAQEFVGVGNGVGQLPPEIAKLLNADMVGG